MVVQNAPDEADPLIGETAEAFGELTSPYRRELVVHCYRMLGSIDDAEDAVQDALARAWRGRITFQRAISFRAWLYRIATNTCLDAIERRKRDGDRALGIEPIPDDLLDETSAGPEARYDALRHLRRLRCPRRLIVSMSADDSHRRSSATYGLPTSSARYPLGSAAQQPAASIAPAIAI